MSLRSFLTGLFRGYAADGELDDVRAAARQDARTFTGTYLREFLAESERLMQGGTQRMLGEEVEHDEAIDGEFEVVKPRRKKAKVKRR